MRAITAQEVNCACITLVGYLVCHSPKSQIRHVILNSFGNEASECKHPVKNELLLRSKM
jgi:hypothetical protein